MYKPDDFVALDSDCEPTSWRSSGSGLLTDCVWREGLYCVRQICSSHGAECAN
jgi:hypothetical protein